MHRLLHVMTDSIQRSEVRFVTAMASVAEGDRKLSFVVDGSRQGPSSVTVIFRLSDWFHEPAFWQVMRRSF